MAIQSGRFATVRSSFGTLPFLGKWDINFTGESLDATYFGSVWKKSMPGMEGWNGSLEGYFDNSTLSTQMTTLMSAVFKATLIQDARFYIDTSSGEFFMPNFASTSSTDAGMYFNTMSITADKNAITTIKYGFIGYGPIALFSNGTSGGVVMSDT